jgi:DNA mismatch endonuclease (patch repair protein)
MDVFSKAKRSLVMAAVKSKGNRATELRLAALFRRTGITGWRRNQPVIGKPDFVFRSLKTVVFVDGCFWHSCPRHKRVPKDNRAFWKAKLDRNVARDREVNRELRRRGWRVVRVWEHDLTRRREIHLAARLLKALCPSQPG